MSRSRGSPFDIRVDRFGASLSVTLNPATIATTEAFRSVAPARIDAASARIDCEIRRRCVHLYRIMTDVRSGSAEPKERGVAARGIATVWVEADSAENAIKRGREVIDNRHYARTGELTLFREENTHVASDSCVDADEGVAAAYVATKSDALRRSNGLFEIWFPPTWN